MDYTRARVVILFVHYPVFETQWSATLKTLNIFHGLIARVHYHCDSKRLIWKKQGQFVLLQC